MRAFISYSSHDRQLARQVAELLRTRDVSVWIDEGQLGPGDSLATSLASAIGGIQMFVVILTANSIGSTWVRRELRIAVKETTEKSIQVVPLRFDDSPIPKSLRGLVWGDGRTPQGLLAAINLALRKQGKEFPLSEDALEKRFCSSASVEYAVRLVPTSEYSPDGLLGPDERKYVCAGDYAEQVGRSLRQVQSNLGIGDAFDRVESANLHWTAIVFEVGDTNRLKLDLMPGTWKAVFRILTGKKRLALFDPSESEIAQLGPRPHDYYQGDQNYWYSRIRSLSSSHGPNDELHPDNVLKKQLGIYDLCFDGSGRLGLSRIFLLKNARLRDLNYRAQDLRSVNDGITLV